VLTNEPNNISIRGRVDSQDLGHGLAGPPAFGRELRIRVRLLVACSVGLSTAIAVFLCWRNGNSPDFYQPWLGAKLLLEGKNPYELIGPGREFVHEFRFFYPLTASILLLPLGFLSLPLAIGIFSGMSSGLLAFALTKDGYWRLPMLVSVPFLIAAWAGQWSILFTAVFLLPAVSFLYVAKPSVGLAYLLANPRLGIALVGGVFLLVFSLFLVPEWPREWMSIISTANHMNPPLMRPGGWVALLALIRWRRPEARLIAFLSVIPQTVVWYEALPLQLAARNLREAIALAVLASLPLLSEAWFGLSDGILDAYPAGWELAIFAYLPAVALVLLPRAELKSARKG
jgi:hypothetical protein